MRNRRKNINKVQMMVVMMMVEGTERRKEIKKKVNATLFRFDFLTHDFHL